MKKNIKLITWITAIAVSLTISGSLSAKERGQRRQIFVWIQKSVGDCAVYHVDYFRSHDDDRLQPTAIYPAQGLGLEQGEYTLS